MIRIDKCPICFSEKQSSFILAKDHLLSQEEFNIVECETCHFKFTNPRPADKDLGQYYKSDQYISHTNTTKGIVSKLYQLIRNRSLKVKESYLASHVSRGTLLDYGCGTGHFLAHCKSKGWLIKGIEPDSEARAIAESASLDVYEDKQKFLSANPGIKFEAITLWHVLEHVTDLDETVNFLSKHLKENGNLFIAVPNHKSYDANYYKKFWAAFDVPRHLYHFDKQSMSFLMERRGFILKEIKPMLFDSFYVSMLSERNRAGRINYLRAGFIGLISNLMASTKLNHSSLIYRFIKSN